MTIVSTVKLSKDIRKIVVETLRDHYARVVTNVEVVTARQRRDGNIALNAICDRVAVKFAAQAPTLREKTRARVKKALKAVSNKGRVVNGTRFIDPKTKMVYAAGSKARGKWLSTGVKNTHLVGEYTERVILGNLTPFQPKRAR